MVIFDTKFTAGRKQKAKEIMREGIKKLNSSKSLIKLILLDRRPTIESRIIALTNARKPKLSRLQIRV